jgi:predicted nucleic acid-binding protein
VIVLDASATIARYHHDEVTLPVLQAFDKVERTGALVPPFWRIEIANVLQMKVRKGRYDATERDRILQDISDLPIVVDPSSSEHVWTGTLRLAHRYDLTVYDAIYLECAVRNRLPLVTLDEELRAAATPEGVPLLGL